MVDKCSSNEDNFGSHGGSSVWKEEKKMNHYFWMHRVTGILDISILNLFVYFSMYTRDFIDSSTP